MNKAQMVFKAIDGIMYPTQNMMKFPNVSSVLDIPYDEYPKTKLDLYYRNDILTDGQKHPVIVYFHGGGFVMGDKKFRVSISEYYANKGYFVCCLNYRMPPDVAFPEMAYDFILGFNYLRTLAEEYNMDLDNIFVTGDSAGAFCTSYLAAVRFDDELRARIGAPEVELDIKGLMLMCGIYDIEVLLQGSTLFGVIPKAAQMLVGEFPLKKDMSNFREFPYYRELSPSDFVNDKWCSTFICWAEDDLVCQNQGEPMADRLRDVVPYFDSFSVKGIQNNHCFHLEFGHSKLAMECMERSADFISKVLELETITK